MNTSTLSTKVDSHDQHPTAGIAVKVGRFLWHLVQMVLAMEAGMMVYHLLLWPVLAPTGYGALTSAYPLFGYWMMLVSMVLGMIALMRFHRSNWRYILEMTIAMLAPLAVLTVLVLCSRAPHSYFVWGGRSGDDPGDDSFYALSPARTCTRRTRAGLPLMQDPVLDCRQPGIH